ncbi:MAG: hypothetical protein ACKVPJ_10790 [Chitinophagales bacterium]
MVDKPNERSSHNYLPVRGGGIIFPLAILAWFFLAGSKEYFFLVGFLILSVISFIDDINPVHYLVRLVLQSLAVVLLILQMEYTQSFSLYYIICFLVLLYFLNMYNFMDGINGMTGCYSLTAFISYLYINTYTMASNLNLLAGYLTIAILVFLFFNFRKQALSFAGDVGSMSIAFALGFMFLSSDSGEENLQLFVFFSVYLVDTLTTIMQRLNNRENIFLAHRKHLYQVLSNEFSIDQRIISIAYMSLQMIVNCIFIFSNRSSFVVILLLLILTVLCVGLKIRLYRILQQQST